MSAVCRQTAIVGSRAGAILDAPVSVALRRVVAVNTDGVSRWDDYAESHNLPVLRVPLAHREIHEHADRDLK